MVTYQGEDMSDIKITFFKGDPDEEFTYEHEDEEYIEQIVSQKRLLHSHELLSLEDLLPCQIELVESATQQLKVWMQYYSIVLYPDSTRTILSANVKVAEYVLAFLTRLHDEVSLIMESEEFKKSVQSDIDTIIECSSRYSKLYKYYYPKNIHDKYQKERDIHLKKSMQIRQLPFYAYSDKLEIFFNADCFEYEHKGDISIFKQKVIDIYFALLIIQESKNSDKAIESVISAAKLIGRVCKDNTYEFDFLLNDFRSRKKAFKERAIKGSKARHFYTRKFADKVYELFLSSGAHPNQSKSVKLMIPDLKVYSIHELAGYWPEAEDEKLAILRVLRKQVKNNTPT